MTLYIIRNDRTGRTWAAHAAEARLYAVGGVLDPILNRTVFPISGNGLG